jgi:Na+-transporting NADH:ubiquinone oxidoreductase subunit A
MGRHVVKKGLDLPIAGRPDASVTDIVQAGKVAVLGRDFHDLRPRLQVEVGQPVERGRLLVRDARHRGVRLTSPAAGVVEAIHRGERRELKSVVVRLDEDRAAPFASHTGRAVEGLTDSQIRDLLVESGLWTSLRTRPFGRVPSEGTSPASIFVNAMSTEPLAPPVEAVLEGLEDPFLQGLAVLGRLTGGPVFVCTAPGFRLPLPEDGPVRHEEFEGPHPAGLTGTHIHLLDPVKRGKAVWHLSAIDTAAIGHLFIRGELLPDRLISLAGPGVTRPRLIRTCAGASTEDLVRGELAPGTQRIVSGSALSGHIATGPETGFLGRYDSQLTVLPEGGRRTQPAWAALGFDLFTVTRAFMSAFFPRREYAFDTSAHAAWRAMIPLEAFEEVMPLDILPTPLLRALAARDPARAESLGCLELAEEDLALCTFVDPGKNDWGRALRRVLAMIEKEG